MAEGKIISIRGIVIDVQFPEDQTPNIYDALIVEDKQLGKITLEVEAVIDSGLVRAVAMSNVYGLKRGAIAKNTGSPIEIPVGEATLGRITNVLGEPIDEGEDIKTEHKLPIHREAPRLEDQAVKVEVFETGIKVIDLI
ncbi:MAG TPA: F0F1 ATP synthase subunit beta, partial [Candidatus Woesebacteria bacterium]|nr:F0F1 ATP synthase subunit beta [Candidatus Woesebacteria bacterium]